MKLGEAYLSWSTATEVNNRGFEIERSEDGIHFTGISFIKADGSINKITNYTYNDPSTKNLISTAIYYRLKQIDEDGKTSYSKTVQLNLKNSIVWKLYPNPAWGKLNINLDLNTASTIKIQVITKDGKIISISNEGFIMEGNHQFSINISNVVSGTYIIRVIADNQITSRVFVKASK